MKAKSKSALSLAFAIDNITLTAIPEPSAAAAFGAMGALALLGRSRF